MNELMLGFLSFIIIEIKFILFFKILQTLLQKAKIFMKYASDFFYELMNKESWIK